MSKLNKYELAKLWYHSFIETDMTDKEKETFENMCSENEIKPNVVKKEIYMGFLRVEYEDDLVDGILSLVEKHYDKVVNVMCEKDDETLSEVALIILEDCDKYGIDPTDVVVMIELEANINGEVI